MTSPGASRGPERPSREAVISLLSDLVAIDSINPSLVPGAAGESRIARFVAEWLGERGLSARVSDVAPGRPNVVARLTRGEGRSLLLNAHVDTVGVAGMDRPFEPRVEGDRLYGRGAYDMKGGLAAIMLAAATLAASEVDTIDLVVTAVADEEYASLGTEAVVRELRADGAVVTEPTGLRLCVAHKGFAWLSIQTAGKAAHGSRPQLGVDAIAHMGRVLGELESLGHRLGSGRPHPLLGHGSLHASLIEGGQELSSYPERCRLQVERRTIPGEGRDAVAAEIDGILADLSRRDPSFSAAAELFFWREPFEVAPEAAVVRAVRDAAADVLGGPPPAYGDTPWMDAALLSSADIPTVVFGPGGSGAHATEEYALIAEVAACAEVLARAAVRFCAGD